MAPRAGGAAAVTDADQPEWQRLEGLQPSRLLEFPCKHDGRLLVVMFRASRQNLCMHVSGDRGVTSAYIQGGVNPRRHVAVDPALAQRVLQRVNNAGMPAQSGRLYKMKRLGGRVPHWTLLGMW